MWGVVALLVAGVVAAQGDVDPVKAQACVMLTNDFVIKDGDVANTIKESAYPHHETLKHISIDLLIYCYNHIPSSLALQVLNEELSYKDPQVKEVCKYRKALFAKKDGEIAVGEERLKVSKRILEAGQMNKRKKRKNDL